MPQTAYCHAFLWDEGGRYRGLMERQGANNHDNEGPRIERVTSETRADGSLVELVFDPVGNKTSLVVWKDDQWGMTSSVASGENRRIAPWSADNNLIKTGAITLPSCPEDYGSERELIEEIQAYIHKYVDLSAAFERLASYYVLLSWVYDAFNEVPY